MKQYIVDAFTNKPFSGNPAAVCVMENWPSEEAAGLHPVPRWNYAGMPRWPQPL